MSTTPKQNLNDIETAICSVAKALVNTIHTVPTNASKKDFEFAINDAFYGSIHAVRENIYQSGVIDPTVIVSACANAKPAFIRSLKKSIKKAATELEAARAALEAKATTTAALIATIEAIIREVRDAKSDLKVEH